MRLYSLLQKQLLPIPLQEAWDFFGNPANLPLITSPDLGFKITSPLPERMHAGMIVTYTVTPFGGFPVKWVTEITHAEPPRFFVDEQRFGPYRFWHHQHHFREAPGGIEMVDLVHYALPFGPLGGGWPRRWSAGASSRSSPSGAGRFRSGFRARIHHLDRGDLFGYSLAQNRTALINDNTKPSARMGRKA